MKLRNRLKVLRVEREWTQEDLAKKLNITRQTVIAVEKGKYNPSLNLAFKMAKLFDCRIEEIFIFEEKSNCTLETEKRRIK
ncbi:MAG: helix-turn-helix transcriptional regulator, partial [Candidatus Heimdallarchaeota archaeon]